MDDRKQLLADAYVYTLPLMIMDAYTLEVAIPSLTINVLSRMKKLPFDHYSAPWEHEADSLGGVQRPSGNSPWSEEEQNAYDAYLKLIEIFF